MTVDELIVQLVHVKPRSRADVIGAVVMDLAVSEAIVKMRIGAMINQYGKVHELDGLLHATESPSLAVKISRPYKKRGAKLPAVEPVAFDVAVWMDGTVLVKGGGRPDAESTVLTFEQARILQQVLSRMLPVDAGV